MLLGSTAPGKNMPRFEYDRMNGQELHLTLQELGMPPYGFARIFGVRATVVKRWLRGEQDVPPWVYVALSMFYVDGAIAAARQAAAQHIRKDNRYPNRGDFPYLKGGDLMEGDGNDDD
jgi:hypothetical protein